MDKHPETLTLNEALVDTLKARGAIATAHVEAAFRAVLRHIFVPEVPLEKAYANQSIPTKRRNDQWVSSSSEPSIMAIMLEQLDVQPGQKVLEIGAGTGYNAALLAHLVGERGEVITVDIDEDIVEEAREHLAQAGVEWVQVVCADGGYGYSAAAPYDRIILTVGMEDISPAWREQLKPGGRLVLPLGVIGGQHSMAFEQSDSSMVSRSIVPCGFMPPRGQFAAPRPHLLQLGARPDLRLYSAEKCEMDSATLYEWLTGPSKDWQTGVEIRADELFCGGLRIWLDLHAPELGELVATGERIERNIVPPLISLDLDDGSKLVMTVILLSETSLVALRRPPDHQASLIDGNTLRDAEESFPVWVRQFGDDAALARRFVALVKTWEEAGRPSWEGLVMRVYPKDVDYTPTESEDVIEKSCNRFVLAWKGAG